MFYYVYILKSIKHKKLYIGFSSNLRERVDAHNSGKSPATKPYIPYQLIFYEAFLNEKDAKSREEYLKTGYGLRSIKKWLKRYFDNNSDLNIVE
jgi:putative endonuclease